MTRFVLLRHELPDGSWHFDWLLDPGGPRQHPDERRLLAFRTRQRPEVAGAEGFGAQQLPDHRLLYLNFEGELPGATRGKVQRLMQGDCDLRRPAPGRLEITLRPKGRPPVSLEGRQASAEPGEDLPRWQFRLMAGDGPQPGGMQERLGNSERVRR